MKAVKLKESESALLEEIFKPTQTAAEKKTTIQYVGRDEEAEKPKVEIEPEPEETQPPTPPDEEAPQKSQAEPLDLSFDAGVLVEFIGSASTIGFSQLYKKRKIKQLFGSKAEYKSKLDLIGKTDLSDTEKEDLQKLDELHKLIDSYIRDSELSQAEKDMLKKPLEKIMERANKSISPEWSLIIAALIIFVPRFINLLSA
jgi:hypothetical protein